MKLIISICIFFTLSISNYQSVYSQSLEVIKVNKAFIYQDSLAKTFERIIPSDGPEASVLWNAPSFKFLYSISDTLRIKQLVNHLGEQFLNDKIKRIVKKENQKQEKDIFCISLRYNKQGKMASVSIVIGEKLRDKITDKGVRELYAAIKRSTIGPQFLEDATRIDENQPDATTGRLQIYLVPTNNSTTFDWMTVDLD